MASFHINLRCWHSIPATAKKQLLCVQVQSHSHCLLVLLLIGLFEILVKVRNFLHTLCWLIKSPVFCIFHFIPRMFSSFTQHCCFPNIFHPRAYVVVGQRVWGRRVGQHYHLPCLENVRNILSVVGNMADISTAAHFFFKCKIISYRVVHSLL